MGDEIDLEVERGVGSGHIHPSYTKAYPPDYLLEILALLPRGRLPTPHPRIDSDGQNRSVHFQT